MFLDLKASPNVINVGGELKLCVATKNFSTEGIWHVQACRLVQLGAVCVRAGTTFWICTLSPERSRARNWDSVDAWA